MSTAERRSSLKLATTVGAAQQFLHLVQPDTPPFVARPSAVIHDVTPRERSFAFMGRYGGGPGNCCQHIYIRAGVASGTGRREIVDVSDPGSRMELKTTLTLSRTWEMRCWWRRGE